MLVGGLDGRLSHVPLVGISNKQNYLCSPRITCCGDPFCFLLHPTLLRKNFFRALIWEPLLHRIVEPQSGSVAPRPAETTGGMRRVAHRPFCDWKFLVLSVVRGEMQVEGKEGETKQLGLARGRQKCPLSSCNKPHFVGLKTPPLHAAWALGLLLRLCTMHRVVLDVSLPHAWRVFSSIVVRLIVS